MGATRIWIGAGVAAVLVVVAAGAAMRYFMGRAMYRPGAVRTAGAALQPPAQDSVPAGFWRVAPGILLRHFEAGSGTDVLVVHGGPGFPPLRPWLAADRTGPAVHWIFYQQRGCGESTRPISALTGRNRWREIQRAESTLGLGAQVADIERIRRLLGQDRLVLVGHSFGAVIAALYAAEFPEHVRALVFVSPAPLIVMPAERPGLFETIGRRLPPGLAADYAAYRKQYFDFNRLFAMDERSLSAFYGEFARYFGAATGPAAAAPASAVGGSAPAPGGWMTLAVYLSMGRRHDWRAALAPVKAPVLVLHGANDMIPEAQTRAFAALFPRARFEVVPGAGHFSFDEQPADFAGRIVRFLQATT